ncbi:bcl-2-like protein 10 [Latimeria chalumnae]|uniref:BCL2 like 10 n=1 Tax=Latimeria chalumnae TaxID=7897 RepID=H3ALX7_LATCH|nr:PREDICTED: bcl-2-like protein 10 [Latimeria chalumnae]|eukprot:XP_006009177.1 PREDICTED: bcl-2-like protein 10 [Latimeria chalumnae]
MCDSLKEETRLLANDFIQFCLGSGRTAPNPAARVLRRVTAELERQNQALFDSFQGNCGPEAELGSVLKRVAEQLEAEGGLNWGRVVSLFAFAGCLAKGVQRAQNEECAMGACCGKLAEALVNYLAKERGDWLEENGGWDGFYKFFERSDHYQESTVRNALMAAAGFGIAGLAFLLAVR